MTQQLLTATIEVPEGCTFEKKGGELFVKGPKGEVVRKMADKKIAIKQEGNILTLSYKQVTKTQKKQLHSTRAHIRNMFEGVQNGYTYKLKICSGHFPMTVTLKDNKIEIKNFIGEAVPRVLILKPGAEVKVNGEEIIVTSLDKEKAGQTAASIEKLTRRPGFDKRIFQDGIYIVDKNGKAM